MSPLPVCVELGSKSVVGSGEERCVLGSALERRGREVGRESLADDDGAAAGVVAVEAQPVVTVSTAIAAPKS